MSNTLRWVGYTFDKPEGWVEDRIASGQILVDWQWVETAMCLECTSMPCMVLGCQARAERRVPHTFCIGGLGTTKWNDFGIHIPNDLWLCKSHADATRVYQLVRMAGVGLTVLGGIAPGIGFVDEEHRAVLLSVGLPVFAAGIGGIVTAYVLKRQQKLRKKPEYVDEATAVGGGNEHHYSDDSFGRSSGNFFSLD